MKFKHSCSIENAAKFADWIVNRGGVAVWKSIDLSDPGRSMSSPATIRRGDCQTTGCEQDHIDSSLSDDDILPYPKPHWKMGSTPTVITDPAEIEVYQGVEVKAFHVGVRMGAQGFSLKVTDGGTRRIRAEVEKAGEGAYYEFAYGEEKNCVIYKTTTIGSLKEWMEKNEHVDSTVGI